MKKLLTISFLAAVLILALFYPGCKTADEPAGEYTLTITLSKGIVGAPEAGVYHYDSGSTVNYSYSLTENYSNLRMKLDGEDAEASGTITITQDHTLNGYADPEYNIMGSWTMEEEYNDGRSFTVTVTFTGDKESGTVTDSDGGNGTYEVDKTSIKFNLEFTTVTYEYSGLFSDVDNISGTCKRISSTNQELSGKWLAQRISSSSSNPSSRGKKGKE